VGPALAVGRRLPGRPADAVVPGSDKGEEAEDEEDEPHVVDAVDDGHAASVESWSLFSEDPNGDSRNPYFVDDPLDWPACSGAGPVGPTGYGNERSDSWFRLAPDRFVGYGFVELTREALEENAFAHEIVPIYRKMRPIAIARVSIACTDVSGGDLEVQEIGEADDLDARRGERSFAVVVREAEVREADAPAPAFVGPPAFAEASLEPGPEGLESLRSDIGNPPERALAGPESAAGAVLAADADGAERWRSIEPWGDLGVCGGQQLAPAGADRRDQSSGAAPVLMSPRAELENEGPSVPIRSSFGEGALRDESHASGETPAAGLNADGRPPRVLFSFASSEVLEPGGEAVQAVQAEGALTVVQPSANALQPVGVSSPDDTSEVAAVSSSAPLRRAGRTRTEPATVSMVEDRVPSPADDLAARARGASVASTARLSLLSLTTVGSEESCDWMGAVAARTQLAAADASEGAAQATYGRSRSERVAGFGRRGERSVTIGAVTEVSVPVSRNRNDGSPLRAVFSRASSRAQRMACSRKLTLERSSAREAEAQSSVFLSQALQAAEEASILSALEGPDSLDHIDDV